MKLQQWSNTQQEVVVSSPSSRAVPLQVSNAFLALCQIAFAANDPQFVLVGGGQVDGPRGDGWAKVARVRNIQVRIRMRPAVEIECDSRKHCDLEKLQ